MQEHTTHGYDYEIFVGPFSTHVYSRADVFYMILTAVDLGMLTKKEGEDAAMVAYDVITGKTAIMRGVNKFTIHDRAAEERNREKAKEETENAGD